MSKIAFSFWGTTSFLEGVQFILELFSSFNKTHKKEGHVTILPNIYILPSCKARIWYRNIWKQMSNVLAFFTLLNITRKTSKRNTPEEQVAYSSLDWTNTGAIYSTKIKVRQRFTHINLPGHSLADMRDAIIEQWVSGFIWHRNISPDLWVLYSPGTTWYHWINIVSYEHAHRFNGFFGNPSLRMYTILWVEVSSFNIFSILFHNTTNFLEKLNCPLPSVLENSIEYFNTWWLTKIWFFRNVTIRGILEKILNKRDRKTHVFHWTGI